MGLRFGIGNEVGTRRLLRIIEELLEIPVAPFRLQCERYVVRRSLFVAVALRRLFSRALQCTDTIHGIEFCFLF